MRPRHRKRRRRGGAKQKQSLERVSQIPSPWAKEDAAEAELLERAESSVDRDILKMELAVHNSPNLTEQQTADAADFLHSHRDGYAVQGVREWKDLNPRPRLPEGFEQKWGEVGRTVDTLKRHIVAVDSYLASDAPDGEKLAARKEREVWTARLTDMARWMLSSDATPLQSHLGRRLDAADRRELVSLVERVEVTPGYRLRNVRKLLPPPPGPEDRQVEASKLNGRIVEFCRRIYNDLRLGMSRHNVARKYGFKVPAELPVFEKARRIGMAYAKGVGAGAGYFSQLPEGKYGKKPPFPKGYPRTKPHKPKKA